MNDWEEVVCPALGLEFALHPPGLVHVLIKRAATVAVSFLNEESVVEARA